MFLSLIKPFCSLEMIYGIVLVKKYKMHGTPVLERVARGLSDFVLFRVCSMKPCSEVFLSMEKANSLWLRSFVFFSYFVYIMCYPSSC